MLNKTIGLTLVLLGLSGAALAGPPQTMTALAGEPAPDFSLPDVDGKRYRLSELRGRVVLVNFWATWCPPCRREMPSLQRLWEQLKDRGVTILAIDVGEDEDTIFGFSFATGTTLDFPILLDRESKVIEQWPVRALPTSFVVDRAGKLRYRAVGGREWDDPALVEQLQSLLNESSPDRR